ncbi:MAG: nucleotide exchange factor GrpE [Verrucomicrobiales bacterium]|nr:nucleotide exchange factor GrpE [Verrucomicrobiales bacterium]|tara:strand:+ start:15453 stop:16037 length:585 start_codon:yes stop_codon:yes gene_type:complete
MSSVEEEFNPDESESEGSEEAVSNESTEGPESVETEFSVPEEDLTPAAEVEKWKDVAARSQAELDNYRKRMAREKTEAIVFANRSLLEQLFPIIDNFEMGLKAAQDSEGEDSMIFQGMTMVYKQIGDFLSEQGVEIIESDAVSFDPNLHEAIKQESSEEVAEGQILYTLRRGYRLKERVLRAANVVVSSGPSEA